MVRDCDQMRVLRHESEGGEARIIEFVQEDDVAKVREVVRGSLAAAIYGTSPHAHEVRIKASELRVFSNLMNEADGLGAMRLFFGDGNRVLLDLQDWLGAHGIAFEYSSPSGWGASFRGFPG
ncbi:MAG: hypothetical protein J6D54_07270 [Olsenella sp.]|nr:hypothetical protein [Olsenella sp.]